MNSGTLDQSLYLDHTSIFDEAIDAGVADPVTEHSQLSEVLRQPKSIDEAT
jgi:hypothetical protein